MIILLFLILSVLPTIWAHLCARAVLQTFESRLVRHVSAWFFGQFVLVWLTLTIATILAPVTDKAFVVSVFSSLLIITFGILRWKRLRGRVMSRNLAHTAYSTLPNFWEIAIISFGTIFSACFYHNHLWTNENGDIFRSRLYWDFAGQFSLIQAFAIGNNFPPQNELFTGAPLTYHYFFFLWVAIYNCFGSELSLALNTVSILSFAAVLILVSGVAQEFTKSKLTASFALLLSVTTASLRWLDLLLDTSQKDILHRIALPFLSNSSPDQLALTPSQRFGYNGNMFNLFYFLQERQLAVGCIVILIGSVLLLRRNHLTLLQCVIVGSLIGLCVQWHLYSLIVVGVACTIIAAWDSPRKNAFAIGIPFALIAGTHLLILKTDVHSEFFHQSFRNVPRLDFGFSTVPEKFSLSPFNVLQYWVFAFGPKIVLIPAGIAMLARINKSSMRIMVAFLLPALLLTATVRLAPLSIYDNHKWIRPALLLSDTCSAITVVWFITSYSYAIKFVGIVLVTLSTLSGIVEGYGYFKQQRSSRFANTISSVVREVMTRSNPGDSFITENPKDILLAGRKLYVVDPAVLGGNPRMDLNFIKRTKREKLVNKIKSAETIESICSLVAREPIDYVELKLVELNRLGTSLDLPNCLWPAAQTSTKKWVRMFDVKCGCRLGN